jgi:squalene synthase HpnD
MQQAIHKITRRSGSNLALSFISLPREKKEAMSVFYAFCRVVDDISDDRSRPVEVQRAQLDHWRAEIRACYQGTPTTTHGRALQTIIRTYLIPPQPFFDIIDGVEMDLVQTRYATFAELERYCYRVASAVGLVSIEIFGYSRPASKDYAVALGMAFQLTNILRDVRYDLETYGRIYLPQDELRAFGVEEDDLTRTDPHPGKDRLFRMQYFRALHYFHKAARLLPAEDRPNFIAAELMTEVYHRMLEKIRAAGFPSSAKPIRLNHWEKLQAVRHALAHGATINRPNLTAPSRIAVWGAGFAGMAAAFHAGLQGHVPEVFEAKSYAGGRAHSFTDAKSGVVLDNGQHIFMGCYTTCLELFELLGVTTKLDLQDAIEVPFISATRGRTALRASRLPAPLHLLTALWSYDELSHGDRLSILGFGLRLRWGGASRPGESVVAWLRRLGQTPGAIRALWEPLCIAALNEPIASADAALFETVLRRSLFGSRAASAIYISRVGLSELLLPELRLFLESIGGSLHLGEAIQSVHAQDGRITSVTTSQGRVLDHPHHICALPWSAVRTLLPAGSPPAECAAAIASAPILALHLFTDRRLIDAPFVGFLDSPLHWIFDRSHQCDEPGQFLYSIIISAAYELAQLPKAEFLEKVWDELRRLLPSARDARMLHHVLYKSKDATFAARPETSAHRPGPRTGWSNLVLAGDWTNTGLPGTLEGAAWSGKRAVASLDAAK